MSAVSAGLLLGIAGSLHCLGMCGPLVMAWRGASAASPARMLAYHLSRISTYVLLGAIFGRTVTTLGPAARGLSMIFGAVLVFAALGMWPWGTRLQNHVSRAWTRLWVATRTIAPTSSFRGASMAGAINALLPCGMVYTAIIAAAAFDTPAQSAGFMLAYGIGTTPALWLPAMVASYVSGAWRGRFSRLTPVAMALVGLLLVGRGLVTSHTHATTQPHPSSPTMTMPASHGH